MPSNLLDLPVHPFTGLQALAVIGGRPVWPVMGASDDDGGSDDSGGTDDAPPDADGGDTDDQPEPPALVEERTARKALETVLAELTGKSKGEVRRLLKGGTSAALEALRPPADGDSSNADTDRAVQEATDRANARIVRSEVKALAAESFADPADAHLYLDLSSYDVDDDGEVDAAAIRADLKKVLTAKPHLAKKRGPRPDPSQGRGGSDAPDPGPGVNRMRAAYASSGS